MTRPALPSGPSRALPATLGRPIGAVGVLAAMVVAVLGVAYAGDGAASWIDRWFHSVVVNALPSAHTVALVLDYTGEPLGAATLISLLAVVCLVLGRRRLSVLAVAGPCCTIAITTILLKPVVGRTIHGAYLAYPSGHTAVVTALTLVLALLAVDLIRAGTLSGILLVLAAAAAAGAAMAWAQITLGAHYPTDTLGGFCTALAVVPAAAQVVDLVADRRIGAVPHGGRL